MSHRVGFLLLLLITSAIALDFNYYRSWIGVGYDLVNSNPMIGNEAAQETDPGFYSARRILRISDVTNTTGPPGTTNQTQSPPEVEWVQRSLCANGLVEHTYFSGRSYQQRLLESVKIDSDNDLDIMSVAFVGSDYYKSVVRDTAGIEGKVIHEVITQCTMGTIRYKTELQASPVIESAFSQAVCALPAAYSAPAYVQFIQHWGTHAVIGFDYGHEQIKVLEGSRQEFMAALLQAGDKKMVNTGPYQNYSESYTIKTEDISTYSVHHVSFGGYTLQLAHGDLNNLEPLSLILLPISDVITSLHWDTAGLPVDCQGHLAQFGANLKTAITEYAKTFTGPSDDPTSFVTPLAWPSGQFGLPQPKAGCSSDGVTTWETGSREFSPESYFTSNRFSSPLNIAGEFNNKKIVENFCVKTSTTSAPDWPKGSYCVYQYGTSCSSGFKSGWVKWDDEDGSDNHDHVNGTLPAGVYNDDTKMYFCCRMDNSAHNKILLPNRSPFYLLRFGGTCQQVYGMDVTEEYITFDTEDTFNGNNDEHSPPYPDDGSIDNITLKFCYYQTSSGLSNPVIVG
ncbi:unnamed protein product [Lymnaea stagnalis]|uniref:MACPF domain-containing protein n=1 Tax=Lymnaea stagnalis TaxID=6523 RepID=A0AAV2H4J7_LYMST